MIVWVDAGNVGWDMGGRAHFGTTRALSYRTVTSQEWAKIETSTPAVVPQFPSSNALCSQHAIEILNESRDASWPATDFPLMEPSLPEKTTAARIAGFPPEVADGASDRKSTAQYRQFRLVMA